MGDLPRWQDGVDSQAMYGAYLKYMEKPENADQPHLTMIVHKIDTSLFIPTRQQFLSDIAIPTRYVKQKLCEAKNCPRCEAGRGGYQFKWHSKRWYQDYLKARREGSWKMPEIWERCAAGTDRAYFGPNVRSNFGIACGTIDERNMPSGYDTDDLQIDNRPLGVSMVNEPPVTQNVDVQTTLAMSDIDRMQERNAAFVRSSGDSLSGGVVQGTIMEIDLS